MRVWTWLILAALCGWPLHAAAQHGGVTCESRDGGYRECYTGFRYPPVLVQQISNSTCIEGRSWGHRPGAVWVSRGCRGVFDEGGGSGAGGWGSDEVVCESLEGRYRECQSGFRGPAQLVEQLSNSSCVEGRSWGRTRGGVWVDRGCRGRFSSYYGGGQDDGGGYWEDEDGGYTIECESRNNRHQTCSWDWNAGTPYIVDQLSSSPCVRGRSWGYDRNQSVLWVDQGCRAVFGSR